MKKIICLLFAFLILLSGNFIFTRENADAEIVTSFYLNSNFKPIRINNDTEFADLALTNKWLGYGTINQPLIIENYIIDVEGSGPGIYLGNITINFIIRNCTIVNATGKESEDIGIILSNVKPTEGKNNLEGNEVYGNNKGLSLINSNNCLIKRNLFRNNRYCGIELDSSDNNIIQENVICNNSISSEKRKVYFASGLHISHSSNNQVLNNSIKDNCYALVISNSENILLSQNSVEMNGEGINLYSTHNSTVCNNTIRNNYPKSIFHFTSAGVELYDSNSNEIINNHIERNWNGMLIKECNDNYIYCNQVVHNYFEGIKTVLSRGVLFEANAVGFNNFNGILLRYSDECNLTQNLFFNDYLKIEGECISHWRSHNISQNNKVNGKVLFYLVDKEGITICEDAGQVYIVYSSNITVTSNMIDSIQYGIVCWSSSNIVIEKNTLTNVEETGIFIRYSEDIIVSNNTVIDGEHGIEITSSDNIILIGNHILNSTVGIYLISGSTFRIDNNTFTGTVFGISMEYLNDINVQNNDLSNSIYSIQMVLIKNFTARNNSLSFSGFYIIPFEIEYLHNYDIDCTNTINGREVFFGIDRSDMILGTTYSQIYMVNCKNITIKGSRSKELSSPISLVNCEEVVISNVNLSVGNYRDGISLYSSRNCIIQNATISNSDDGIFVYNCTDIKIISSVIKDNYHSGIIEDSKNISIINNLICENKYGFFIYSNFNFEFRYNNYSNNEDGLSFRQNTNLNFSNNLIAENDDGGFWTRSTNNGYILNNTIEKNDWLGFSIHGDNLVIENNIVFNNNGIGIFKLNSIFSIIGNIISNKF